MTRSKENSETPARRGIGGEFRRLNENVPAVADELREFIGKMKGKSPQEVLGAVAQSGLLRATLVSAAGCVAVLVIFTIIPFGLGKAFRGEKAVAGAPANESKSNAADAKEGATTTPDSKGAPSGETNSTAKEGVAVNSSQNPGKISDDTLERLDLDTKTVDPEVNPLEDSADDLLKGLR